MVCYIEGIHLLLPCVSICVYVSNGEHIHARVTIAKRGVFVCCQDSAIKLSLALFRRTFYRLFSLPDEVGLSTPKVGHFSGLGSAVVSIV